MDERKYDPETLYVWATPKSMQCQYCGIWTPYYTKAVDVPGVPFADRAAGDGRCEGIWHNPVVSLPRDFISGLTPLTPEEMGLILAQCFNLTAQWEDQAAISWEHVHEDGTIAALPQEAGLAKLADAGVRVRVTEGHHAVG